MDDALLFLHVLAAFAVVGSVVVFTVIFLSSRTGGDTPALALTPLARRLWDIGGAGTLLFGIILAVKWDQYGILDGWIIAAIVLWAIAGGAGAQLGAAYLEARDSGGAGTATRTGRVTVLYAVLTITTLALLIDMIYKPGVG